MLDVLSVFSLSGENFIGQVATARIDDHTGRGPNDCSGYRALQSQAQRLSHLSIGRIGTKNMSLQQNESMAHIALATNEILKAASPGCLMSRWRLALESKFARFNRSRFIFVWFFEVTRLCEEASNS